MRRRTGHAQAGLLKQLPFRGSRRILVGFDATSWHLDARAKGLLGVLQYEQLVDCSRHVDERLLAPTMFARKASRIVVRHRDREICWRHPCILPRPPRRGADGGTPTQSPSPSPWDGTSSETLWRW